MHMRVPLHSIKVGHRLRKDIGNIDDLKASMIRHGLLQPIVIDHQYNLIAGFRRYKVASLLGWEAIDATIVDAAAKKDRLSMELDENETRRGFEADEVDKGKKLLELYNKESLFSSFVAWWVSWKG
jgi:ParB family transcriptional regulator, chromosome partitioning protein